MTRSPIRSAVATSCALRRREIVLRVELAEVELLLAVGERQQADAEPDLVGEASITRIVLRQNAILTFGEAVRETLVQPVVTRQGADLLLQRAARQRHDAIAQRKLDRVEPVEAEQRQKVSQGRGIHEEGEQNEADRDDRYELPDRFRDELVLGDRQRQNHRHGAAETSPQDHDLVAAIDRLDEVQDSQPR